MIEPPQDDPPLPPPASAEDAFVLYVMRYEVGERLDPDAYCREHPAFAQELREMLAVWLRLQGVLEASQTYASAADPDGSVSSAVDEAYAREIVERLGERTSAYTRYEEKGEVARGGMGIVRLVWDNDLRRHLAMKVIRERGESGSGSTSRPLARFLEEAQVTAQLDHPGIVPIHEVGLDERGLVYFTMKLVKGDTLGRTIEYVHEQRAGWTVARALRVVLKICEAMAYAHSKGVVHRDLKPSNIMVGRFGEVYVMDWGLARVHGSAEGAETPDEEYVPDLTSAVHTERRDRANREEGSATDSSQLLTLQGRVVGTPAYMPPEQARGRPGEVGPHSDVYSVGAILYHLLSGHAPYMRPGVVATKHSIWRWVQEGAPAPLSEVAPGTPAELVALCEKAMARERADRYPDMGALAADLEAYLEGRVVEAFEGGAVAEARKWVQRNTALAAALAAGVLVLLIGLGSATGLFLRSESRAQDVLRLSAIQILRGLEQRAVTLWPATPERVPDMERWLEHADLMLADTDEHRRVLSDLRSRAGEWTPSEQERDRATHPRAQELANARTELERWEISHGRMKADKFEVPGHFLEQLERQHGIVRELEAVVAVRHTWRLENPREQWWHDQIAGFLEDLKSFEEPDKGLHAEIRKRLAFAREVGERTVDGSEARARWEDAIRSISDQEICPAYGGLAIEPQVGLVPLWRDDASGLWEFAHLQSGEPPTRDAAGRVVLADDSGLVFVLLPGGEFLQGAQREDEDGANYDPGAWGKEGLTRSVRLDPFFASKYEMTQGQWTRVTGSNPSVYFAGYFVGGSAHGPITALHPVESVSWTTCDELVRRLDLALPTEAQWEYLARGGTSTPWWTGDEPEAVGAAANIGDVRGRRSLSTLRNPGGFLGNDDGYPIHAPADTFAPNPFGIHHVLGNVFEWCADGFGALTQPVRVGDGALQGSDLRFRITRGGSYNSSPSRARSAARDWYSPNTAMMYLGLRPVRPVRN